jgi:hypothetical protein
MQDRDPRGAGRMRFHRHVGREPVGLQAEIDDRLVEIRLRHALDDERPAVELHPARLERLFRDLDVGVLQLVAQRDQRVVGVVIDREGAAGARDAARRLDVSLTSSIGASRTFTSVTRTACTANASGKRPPGVVVGPRLRVVRRPVLIIEQRVRRCASTAGPCGRCSSPRGTHASWSRRTRGPGPAACGALVAGSDLCRAPPRPPRPPPSVRGGLTHGDRDAERPAGRARDLDRLFLQTRSSSGLRAEARIVSTGTRRPPVPPVFALRIERLLFS